MSFKKLIKVGYGRGGVPLALCRRTRQIVAFFIADRGAESCQCLWDLIRHSITYSDFWKAYEQVIKTGKHHSVEKDSGQTNHVER